MESVLRSIKDLYNIFNWGIINLLNSVNKIKGIVCSANLNYEEIEKKEIKVACMVIIL